MFVQFFSFLLPFVFHQTKPITSLHPPSFTTTRPTKTLRPTRIPTPTKIIVPKKTITPKPTTTNNPHARSLYTEVNIYRNTHGENALQSDTLLCSIADKRVTELFSRGSLDNHEGIKNYTSQIFTSFSQWWEVIHFSSPAWNANQVVLNGWAKSKGHHEAILSSSATHGCGAQMNGFAVFLLGKKK